MIKLIKEILHESNELSTGIFWYDTFEEKLIVISKYCDLGGNSNNISDYNAKSGLTYNHKNSWNDIKQEYKQYR